jgi:integrase
LQRYVSERKEEVRAATLNNERTAFRRFCKWAGLMGYFKGREHLTTDRFGIIWRRHQVVRRRELETLEREEVEQLCAEAPEWLARYVRLSVWTGLRQGTVRRLTRDHYIRGFLIVPAGMVKSLLPLRVPVPEEVRDWLPLNLPKSGEVLRAFVRAARAAGITRHVTPHDLRRTWVRRMAEAGATGEQVMKLGGWKTHQVMLSHYFTVTDVQARELMEKVR